MIWVGLWAMICGGPSMAAPSEVIELTEVRGDRPTVLVLRKHNPEMDTFVAGLTAEIGGDFNLIALQVVPRTTVQNLAELVAARKPATVVLLDNPTADLYRRYQEAFSNRVHPPAIVAMALFVEQTAGGLTNATGIAYEVPAVTSLVRLRSALTTPVDRVGVIHRPQFTEFIADQERLAAIEGFEIIPIEVSRRAGVGQVRRALKSLDKLGVEALWILNDNVLLTPDVLLSGWLPLLRRTDRPVVVGVDSLLQTSPPVGSFAVLPDHQDLGIQAADLIYELQAANWVVSEVPTQLPISVQTVLHRGVLEPDLDIEALDGVDIIIQ